MVSSTAFAFVAGLVAAAQAYTVADTSVNPSGNAIFTPVTGGSVEAGKTFDITWDPTSTGTVTIYVCKGPSTNCVNGDVPIADKVANSGTFSWAVSTAYEQSATAGQGYGIQLVSDADPKIYQWSGQFGIVNSGAKSSSTPSAASSSSPAAASSSAEPSGSAAPTKATVADVTVSTSAAYGTVTGGATGTGGANTNAIQPTKPMSVPSSLKTSIASATGSSNGTATGTASIPLSTGAASAVKVGAGALFGGILAAALAL